MDRGVAALIPAYDAALSIAAVIDETRRFLPAVVVVDDGSRDDTGRIAAAAGATVLRHPVNRGKGAATNTGLRHLAEAGFGRALTLDADGQHLPSEIPKLLALSDREPDALVLAVRDKRGQDIAAANRVANWVCDRAMSTVAGHRFLDTQCGFRVYPVTATLALAPRGSRMEWDAEILVLAQRAGISIREVMTRVYYPPVAERRSHYRRVEDTMRIAWIVLREMARSRRPLPSQSGASLDARRRTSDAA